MSDYPKDYKGKYWKEVYLQARSHLQKEFGIKGDAVKLAWNIGLGSFLAVLIVVSIGVSVANKILNITDTSVFNTILYVLLTLFAADVVGFLINNYAGIPITAYFRTRFDIAAQRDWEKTNRINELETQLQTKELKLYINHGSNLFEALDDGLAIMCLTVDVVNNESRKILDLEAYLTSVDQITEDLPDNVASSISFRTLRLQWKDGNYITNLTPGWPETPVKIASLNFSNSTFMFIHEGTYNRAMPSLQKDALYKIKIGFKGKLEGDPDYRFCNYDMQFICLLRTSGLHYLPEAAKLPDLPDWLNKKIRIWNMDE